MDNQIMENFTKLNDMHEISYVIKEAELQEVPSIFDQFITPNFPEDEIKPLEVMELLVAGGYYKILYLEVDGEKAGMACLNLCPEGRTCLLDYLAIDASCRAKGYGSLFLKECRGFLDGRAMLIETEAVFAAANDAEKQQRIRRNHFYSRNGAIMTEAVIRMFGVIFTMWSLYDETGLTKEDVEKEMEMHYRFMLRGTNLYEDHAEIPYVSNSSRSASEDLAPMAVSEACLSMATE